MNILLLGANGQVGFELQRSLAAQGDLIVPERSAYDLDRPESLAAMVHKLRPDIIVNAAAYTAVDKAETETNRSDAVNARSPSSLAAAADQIGAWIIHYSTDYVFDGTKSAPYLETDACHPLSAYGRTKLSGEHGVAKAMNHLIFRTSWVHSRRGSNFVKTMCRLGSERDQLSIVDDQFGAPTAASLIADVTALAVYRIRSGTPTPAGVYHLTASGSASWRTVAVEALAMALQGGLIANMPEILPIGSKDYPSAAQRPMNSRLDTSKLQTLLGISLPDWRQGVRRTVQELIERTAK